MNAVEATKDIQNSDLAPSGESSPRGIVDASRIPRVAILDFLFTFCLSAGLVPELFQIEGIHGVLSEPWLNGRDPRKPTLVEIGQIATLIFGVLTLTLSWYGYHLAIGLRPHSANKWEGLVRFQLDIILIILYGVILLLYRRTELALTVVAIAYLIYAIWDWLEGREYNDTTAAKEESRIFNCPVDELELVRRRQVTWLWAVAFFLLALVAWLVHWPGVVMAIVGIVFSVLFRLDKIAPRTWSTFLLRHWSNFLLRQK